MMKHYYLALILFTIFCFSPTDLLFAQDTNQALEESSCEYRTEKTGWMSSVGFGYTTKSGMIIALDAGYKIHKYFALAADIAVKPNFDHPGFAAEFMLVPKFQLNGQFAIFSLGLGLGYAYSRDYIKSTDYIKYYNNYTKDSFIIKPSIGLDGISDSGFLFGFSIGVPVYLGYRDNTVDRHYTVYLPNGNKLEQHKSYLAEENKFTSDFCFDFMIHLGMKFN